MDSILSIGRLFSVPLAVVNFLFPLAGDSLNVAEDICPGIKVGHYSFNQLLIADRERLPRLLP